MGSRTPTNDAIAALVRSLGAPDQGMSYHAGGVEKQRYCSDTGRPLPRDFRSAELTLYGPRADFIKGLIDNRNGMRDVLLEALADEAARAAEMRRTLEWYADPVGYALTQMTEPRSAVHGDGGRRARETLGKTD